MTQINSLRITSDIEDTALDIFRYQYALNPLYKSFVDLVQKDVSQVCRLVDIPFLPISAFKHHMLKTGTWESELVYASSGTRGNQSMHHVRDNQIYLDNCVNGFEEFYDKVETYTFLALLPGYLDRPGSSLITMLQHFIELSDDNKSGFFLHNHNDLLRSLEQCKNEKRKTILWGVSYALLDFLEEYDFQWEELIVLETGGMKGKRKEMIKDELHKVLGQGFNVHSVHSEYGMTELLSQAYSQGGGVFKPTSTLHVHTREIDDPLAISAMQKTGQLHIFDRMNKDSISFIATEDLGRCYEDGSFKIMGRMDYTDQRGCNLLIEEMGIE